MNYEKDPSAPGADPMEGMERMKAAEEEAFDEAAKPISSLVDGAFDLMERRAAGNAKPIATPWPEVNSAMGGGLWPGFHVLSGTTGSGKSQWALQVAYNAANAGHPVLYVGLELGDSDLVARLAGLALADGGGHAPPWSVLYLGRDQGALAAARKKVGLLASLPLYLEVGPPNGWAPSLLAERVAELRRRYPEANGPGSLPLLVVVDYLQIVGHEEDPAQPGRPLRQDLRERIGRAAYAARQVARDHQAVVVALSSVSRENARLLGLEAAVAAGQKVDVKNIEGLGKGDPGRFVGLGKESGEIEFSADSVLVLARGERLESPKRSEAYLAIAKLRARPSGEDTWPVLHFNGGWFTPEDLSSREVRLTRRAKKAKGKGREPAGAALRAGERDEEWRPV